MNVNQIVAFKYDQIDIETEPFLVECPLEDPAAVEFRVYERDCYVELVHNNLLQAQQLSSALKRQFELGRQQAFAQIRALLGVDTP